MNDSQSTDMIPFKRNPFEIRAEVAKQIMEQYPDRYPLIVDFGHSNQNNIVIKKKKFLVPGNITLREFILIARKMIKIERNDMTVQLSVTVAGHIVSQNNNITDLYARFKDLDGFLYIIISANY
ncbi:autophagy protein Atg8 ubiquitin-like protein [Indivirus ILV1]|uniref:Autophagy protein Atg8 ubiquitin-like protein n=1 Tax=Indivirus ILV1 TaxID=1977633 RepID=A0A1V0SE65_9VIRU|nr:autophagy protein Atg8 ubiquitin-like protein [Indivirus ILV1]